MKSIHKFLIAALLLSSTVALAQEKRVSCDILKEIDLKPMLGADHDPLAPFGKVACQAETKSVGRGLVILTVEEGPAADIKKGLASTKRMYQKELTKESTVAAEPDLGPDAFSVRDKDGRKVQFYTMKGNKAVIVQGMWAIGPTIDDNIFGQLRGVAKTAVAKLP